MRLSGRPLPRGGPAEEAAGGFRIRDLLRFILLDLVVSAAVRLFGAAGFLASPDAVVFAVLGGKVILAAYLAWLIGRHRGAWRETGALSLGRPLGWLAASLAYALAYPLLTAADSLNKALAASVHEWLGLVYRPAAQPAVEFLFSDSVGAPARLLLVFFVALAGPCLEEAAFRGVGMDAFRRQGGVWLAWFWTSLLFGLFHLSLSLILPLGLLGAVFGLARIISASLWCGLAIHSFHNLLTLCLAARALGWF